MALFRLSPACSLFLRRPLVLVLLIFLFFVAIVYHPSSNYLSTTASPASSVPALQEDVVVVRAQPRVLKATMLYGESIGLYERALQSHEQHNTLHGYEMRVLRESISSGYWNKLSWLLLLVMEELAKPKETRAEWIFYFDTPTLLLNPHIPLHTFLPPSDTQFAHTNFLASRDISTGLVNSNAFFLRVAPWTHKFLLHCLSIPFIDSEADLAFAAGSSTAAVDAQALGVVANMSEYRSNVFYQPRGWYAARATSQGLPDTREGGGDLAVHFAGAELGGAKWKELEYWMDGLEGERRSSQDAGSRWEVPLESSRYPEEVRHFWDGVRGMRRVLKRVQDRAKELGEDRVSEEMSGAEQWLKLVIEYWPERDQLVEDAMRRGERVLEVEARR